jgi:hypothetical protein
MHTTQPGNTRCLASYHTRAWSSRLPLADLTCQEEGSHFHDFHKFIVRTRQGPVFLGRNSEPGPLSNRVERATAAGWLTGWLGLHQQQAQGWLPPRPRSHSPAWHRHHPAPTAGAAQQARTAQRGWHSVAQHSRRAQHSTAGTQHSTAATAQLSWHSVAQLPAAAMHATAQLPLDARQHPQQSPVPPPAYTYTAMPARSVFRRASVQTCKKSKDWKAAGGARTTQRLAGARRHLADVALATNPPGVMIASCRRRPKTTAPRVSRHRP